MFFVYKSPRDYIKTSWIFIAFALAGLFFTLVPHGLPIGFVKNADYGLAAWLNSLIGHSDGYDSFVRFLNSDSARTTGLFIILVICIIFAWRERFYDMGRFLGYLLWMGLGILITLLFAYYVTERIEEEADVRGPAYSLSNFRDINDHHGDWDVRVKDKTSVPSRYATVYFAIFWLALFRSRRLGLALLPPAILFSPAYMLVGREWPGAVLAGIFWGGSVGAFLTRTPLAVIPQWLEDRSMYWVERLMTFWTPALPKQATTERPIKQTVEIPEGPRVTLLNAPAQGRDHLAHLIQTQILPLMNCAPGSEVKIDAIAPDRESEEASRTIRFVTGGGLERGIVIKAAWKNPLNQTQAHRFDERRNAANMHALAQLRGIPVPRLLFTQNTRRLFAPRRFFFTVEDMIHERSLEPGNVSDSITAATSLAHMHSIERPEAGGLFGLQIPRERYPHRTTLPRVRHAYSTIVREIPGAELSFFGQHALNWFWEKSADLIESGRLFHLCHGNLKPENIRIIDGRAVLVSFSKASFDLAGFDVAQSLIGWSGGSRETMESLLDAYVSRAGEPAWTAFRDGMDLFLGMTLFEMLHEHLHRPEDQRDEAWLRKMADRAAKVLRGNVPKPATTSEAAEAIQRLVFS